MARYGTSRWMRIAAGGAMLVAGIAIFVARPGIALAHHVTITEGGACDAWSTKAEYVGGPDDRKIVVDVTINGEHIQQTFYFDLQPGNLGHADYYLLYERHGTGSVTTSGTVTMYQRDGNGQYTIVSDSDETSLDLTCASSSTPTPVATSTPAPTNTPAEPSATPTATATVQEQGTTTPIPTETPTTVPTATNTPQSSATATVVIDGATTPIPTDTPAATNTPVSTATETASTRTPVATATMQASTPPASTPTFVSSVRGLEPPDQPHGGASPRQPTGYAFPATGAGAAAPRGIASGIAGAILAGLGLTVVASGLRRREA